MKSVMKSAEKSAEKSAKRFAMKFSWPKWRPLKFKPSGPRLIFALPRARFKPAHLMIGGGLLGMGAFGALGWLAVWPKLRPPAPVAAPAKPDASAIAPPVIVAAASPTPHRGEKTAAAPAAVAQKAPGAKGTARTQAVAALSAPPPPPSEA